MPSRPGRGCSGCGVRTCSVPARNRWGNTVNPHKKRALYATVSVEPATIPTSTTVLAENGPSMNAA